MCGLTLPARSDCGRESLLVGGVDVVNDILHDRLTAGGLEALYVGSHRGVCDRHGCRATREGVRGVKVWWGRRLCWRERQPERRGAEAGGRLLRAEGTVGCALDGRVGNALGTRSTMSIFCGARWIWMSSRWSAGGYCDRERSVRRRVLVATEGKSGSRCAQREVRLGTDLEAVLRAAGVRQEALGLGDCRPQVVLVPAVGFVHFRLAGLQNNRAAERRGGQPRNRVCFSRPARRSSRQQPPTSSVAAGTAVIIPQAGERPSRSGRCCAFPSPPLARSARPPRRIRRPAAKKAKQKVVAYRGAVVLRVEARHLGLEDGVLDRRGDDVLLHRAPVSRHGGRAGVGAATPLKLFLFRCVWLDLLDLWIYLAGKAPG